MRLLTVCMLAGACVSVSADVQASGSYHRDVYLKEYPEQGCDAPASGRRVHLVLSGLDVSGGDAGLGSLRVNGQEGLNLDTSATADLTYFDWLRAHTNPATGDLWVSFHTRNADWFAGAVSPGQPVVFSVQVFAKNGTALFDPPVKVSCPENAAGGLDVEHVAFRKNGTEAVIHVNNPFASGSTRNSDRNNKDSIINNQQREHEHGGGGFGSGAAGLTISSLHFDGADYSSVPGLLPVKVPAGGAAALVVPLASSSGSRSSTKTLGDVWTLSISTGQEGVGVWGYGGRVPPERFPVHAWPHSDDCPVPGGNATNAAGVRKMGIDSLFYDGGDFQQKCGHSLAAEIDSWVGQPVEGSGWFHAFAPQVRGVARVRWRVVVWCGVVWCGVA
jgi:hypothetical protein